MFKGQGGGLSKAKNAILLISAATVAFACTPLFNGQGAANGSRVLPQGAVAEKSSWRVFAGK